MPLSLRTFLERHRPASLEKAEPDWLERGAAAHQKQEYLTALKAWKIASARGEVEAQYRIGLLYARGEGVVQSIPDAVIWYRQAAEAGHTDAQYQLGLIYLNGAVPGPAGPGTWFQAASQHNSEAAQRTLKILFPNGIAVEKDPKEAMHWMGAAAAGGKVDAQAVVGEMYRWGRGCTQDYAEAARWYWLAAEQGIASAQFAMGDIYYQALGVEVDHQAAAAWYEKAAKNGEARAQVALASMCLAGEGRPADLDQAGRLFVQAAEQGEARGLYQAALMHLKGEGLPENIDRSETYLRRSAKQNYLPAIVKLAEFYAHGRGIEPDLREAAAWHSRAAELGDVQSQFIIGRLYASGTGVPINLRESAQWFLRAAEQGHATAAHNIAVYYANGTGVERDLARATDWYRKAAEEGITASQVQLGKLYCAGEGVPHDLEKATLWLRKAAETGDPEAKTALAMLHLQGEEGVRDASRAEELLKQAAEGGHAAAATQLGHLYSGKYTVETKAGDAVRWYTKAAEAGNIEAQHTLGMLYLNGRGVAKNLHAAANWIEKAAHGDHAPSQFQLAVMFCTAQGVPRDLTQAVSWYEQAAQHGHPLAQYNLAVMLSKGQGCETDEARATSWFQKAAEQGLAEAKRALADLLRAGRLPPPGDEVSSRSLDQKVSAGGTGSHTRNPQRTDQPPTGPSSETDQTSNEVLPSASRRAVQAPADQVESKREPPERRDAARPGLVKQQPTQHGSNLSPVSTHRDRDQMDHRPEGRVANLTPTRGPSNTIESLPAVPADLRPAAQNTSDGVPSCLADVGPGPRVRGDKSHLGLTPAPDEAITNLDGQQSSLDSRTEDSSASKTDRRTSDQDTLPPRTLSSRSASSSESARHSRIASTRAAFTSDRGTAAPAVMPSATERTGPAMAHPESRLGTRRPQHPHSDAAPLAPMGPRPGPFGSTGSLEQRVRHKQCKRLFPSPHSDSMLDIGLPAQMLAERRVTRPPRANLPERERVAHQVGAPTPAKSIACARDMSSLEKALQTLSQLRPWLFSTGNRKRPATPKPRPNQPHDVSVESAPNGRVGAQLPPLSAIRDTLDLQAGQSKNATPTRPRRDESICKTPVIKAISERGNRSRPVIHIDSHAASPADQFIENAVGAQRACARKRSNHADHCGSSKPLASGAASILAEETPKDIADPIVDFGDVPREPNASTPHVANSQIRGRLERGSPRGISPLAGGGRASAGIKPISASGPNKTILQSVLRLSLPRNALLHQGSYGQIPARIGAARTAAKTGPTGSSVATGAVGQEHILSRVTTNFSPSNSSRRFIALAAAAGTAVIVWASVLATKTLNLVQTDSLEVSNVDRREINKTNNRVEVDSDTGLKSKNTNSLSTGGNDASRSLDRPSDQRGGSREMLPAIEAKPLQTQVGLVNRAETRFDLRTAADVQQVQQRLIELGYLPFLADGVWGPHSIQALRAFRTSAGLGTGDQWDRKTEDILFAVTAPRATAPASSPLQLPPG